MDLAGKTVVVTGAGRGFGRAFALHAGRTGAHVFVSARTPAAARRTAEEVAADSGARVEAFACDLADPATVRDFAQQVAAHTPSVDVLINNGAGTSPALTCGTPTTKRSPTPSLPEPPAPC
ncbi:hypothetical protein GCM10010441_13490 [Kitasatospora paracochleata]